MPVYIWAAVEASIAVGIALLAAILTRAQMSVILARQRQELAEARAMLVAQQHTLEAEVWASQEQARTEALEEFLGDIRVEERQFETHDNSLILAERICFRNVPLTPWIEHEVPSTTAVPAPASVERRPRLITSPKSAS